MVFPVRTRIKTVYGYTIIGGHKVKNDGKIHGDRFRIFRSPRQDTISRSNARFAEIAIVLRHGPLFLVCSGSVCGILPVFQSNGIVSGII